MKPRTCPVLRLLVLALASAALAVSVDAQTDPNLERGFAPGKAYSFGELDSVNLFNGNLGLTIPLGGGYPVGGGLSYGLTLVYNSNVWDFETVFRDQPYTQALPARDSNAGLGFQVSLGKLLPTGAGGFGNWRYIGEDGAEHVFYPTRHLGETITAGIFYTRDGSNLRLEQLASGPTGQPLAAEIEMPDGTIRRFSRVVESDPMRLAWIRDPFDNQVDVTYPAPLPGHSARWQIADGHRTHYVNFVTRPNGDVVVANVDLAAFGGSRAVYAFGYSDTTIDRSCLDDDPEAQGGTPPTAAVTLLTSLTLPADAGAFTFGPYNGTCSDGTTTIKNLPGTLSRLTLPTLGRIEWTYQTYKYPVRAGGCGPSGPGVGINEVTGVKTKRVLDAAGNCDTWDGVGCQWSYTVDGVAANPYRSTTVTLPTGDQSIHYFHHSVALSTATWSGWQYGLPIHPSITDGAGRHLSQEVYDGAVKVRSVYRRYEHDKLFSTTCNPDQWYNTDRRVASEKTVFHDDGGRFAEVTHSEYDGLGHYRRSVTSGSFDAGNVRAEFTNHNPASGVYLIDPATNNPGGGHTYVAWAVASPWVLGTFTETAQTEGGVTATQEYCFEGATGFLQRHRVRKAAAAGAGDVVELNTRDAAGNLIREEWFGGDVQALAGSAICSLALSGNRYRADHTYAAGARATSRWVDGAGIALPFYNLQLTIDPGSALPSQSFDVSGIRTNLIFDAFGRPTWERPQTGHGAWVQYIWQKATSASALANVKVSRRPNGSTTGSIAESRIFFDDFGRVWRDQVLGAGGAWSTVDTIHNSLGWKRSVSEREPVTPSHSTVFKAYDPFGRPGTIQPADGSAHNVGLGYLGTREVTRTVKVWDGASEVNRSTIMRYDRQGRLHQVLEPAGPAGANVTTTYGYDVGGRLASVTQTSGGTTQTRTFTYDLRGFLTQEKHPEKGASGNGWVFSYNYDPLGNPGRTADGPSDLTFTYDRASRLTQVRETGGAARTMKVFTYGTANATGDQRLGRLQHADRYNYIQIGTTPYTVQVRETHVYGGPGGLVTARTTQDWVNGGATPSDVFTQGWAYNDLGEVTTLTYPRCLNAGCTGAAGTSRTVTYGYTNGFLTAVPGYATSIGYHPNGMVHQVAHANGVTWTQGLDPVGMRRPASYATTGASVNWTSGAYTWDGAGNVKAIGASSFSYDGASRLLSGKAPTLENGGSATGQRTQSATYDGFGNLTSLTTNGVLVNTPTAASTNRLTAATYDAAGNVTAWNGNTFTWDAVGMPTRTYLSGFEYDHVYTADDERILTYQPNVGYRWTLRDRDGKVLRDFRMSLGNWTVERDYVYRDGAALAAVQSSGEVHHLHPDHLGSPRLITGNGGVKRAFHSYYPYGEEATGINQDAERMKFTGHERDLGVATSAADDLDYMHARYYSSVIARFLSLDPLSGSTRRPQSWNRYAYVGGNPLNKVDPYGLRGESPGNPWSETITVCTIAATGEPCPQKRLRSVQLSVEYQISLSEFSSYKVTSHHRAQASLDRINSYYQQRFEEMAVEKHYTAAFIDYIGLELLFPKTTNELGLDLATTLIPPAGSVKVLSKSFKWIAKRLGISPHQASKAIHEAKHATGRGGADNVLFDPDTGDIIAPETGDIIGNLHGDY